MNSVSDYHFISTTLDPARMSNPNQVQTNWYVLTGAASSGKSTLIEQLAGLGFQTATESARLYIQQELAKGRTFDEIFGNAADTIAMCAIQRAIEQRLRPDEPVFLDRALADSLTFYRFSGLNPNLILSECLQFRYAGVFVLDRLPFQADGYRIDHDPTSNLLDAWLFRDYSSLGYQVRRLPVLPPEKRLAYLLDSVGMRPAG